MELQKGTGIATAKPDRPYTLRELAEGFKEIEKQIIDNGGEVSDDLFELHMVAQNLLAGKFDRVIRFKEALNSHIVACKTQIAANEDLIGKIDAMVKESVEAQPTQRIDGNAYVGKVAKNPSSVEVINEDEVPPEYKNVKIEIKAKFQMTDRDSYCKYRDFIVGRVVDVKGLTPEEIARVDDCIEITVDKKKIAAHCKAPGATVAGTKITQSTRIDVKAGKAKPAMLTEANA
jgi:hypothetical protein